MFVYIAEKGKGPQLVSADDLTSLSVRVEASPVDPAAISWMLRTAGAGDVAADHVWLDISWLRSAAGTPGPDWPQRFAAMLEYARTRGWLSPDGLRVRAHLEQPVTP
jgi:hypothetical protein